MNVVVVGSHGHAGVVVDAIEKSGRHRVSGLLDDFSPGGSMSSFGCKIIGKIEDSTQYDDCMIFVAIGDNKGRKKVVERLVGHGSNLFVSIVHPSASCGLWSVIGRGSLVAANSCIGPNSQVGEFSIINTNASLDHDSKLGNFSHLAPGVVTGGHVTIGDNTFIGLGAMIRDRVKIGNNCTIGMGSVVLKDIPDNSLAYGNPCVLQTTT